MAKTDGTLSLERAIKTATNKQGTFGCFEVTIGWFGNERVDFITYDTKGVWRCYEIKVSKSDFRSKAHWLKCDTCTNRYAVDFDERDRYIRGDLATF